MGGTTEQLRARQLHGEEVVALAEQQKPRRGELELNQYGWQFWAAAAVRQRERRWCWCGSLVMKATMID